MTVISSPWTEPVNLVAGAEADAAQYNDEVVSNIRNLHERNRARGIIAIQQESAAGPSLTASGFTDFDLTPVVSVDRAYRIHLSTPYAITVATGAWNVEVRLNTNTVLGRIGWGRNPTRQQYMRGVLLWLPEFSGAVGLSLYAIEVSGTGTFTLPAAATALRSFWVEDIGARPS